MFVCVFLFAVYADIVRDVMEICEYQLTLGFGTCQCPVDMVHIFEVTLEQLTSLMAQEQPATWPNPGQYCGSPRFNCPEPNCITWMS